MKFFTPDLYLRFNSQNDDEADQANAEWEAALRGYEQRIATLDGSARELTSLNLHDAEILLEEQRTLTIEGTRLSRLELVLRRDDGEIFCLYYVLSADVVKTSPPAAWPFSSMPRLWLYDEADSKPDSNNEYSHRILLSDGTVMAIPFHSVTVQRRSLRAVAAP